MPSITKNPEQLRADLDNAGFCIVEDVLSKADVRQIHTRVEEQAQAEKEQGHMRLDDVQITGGYEGNQYVYMLINKGQVFQKILLQPLVRATERRHDVHDRVCAGP